MILQRLVFISLIILCGVGLLVSWMPQNTPWRIFELAIYGLLIAWLAAWMAGRAPDASRHWLLVPFIAIIGWGLLQLWSDWTVYRYVTAGEVLRWGSYASVFLLAFQTSAGRGDGRLFCRMLAVYGFIVAVVSVFQFFSGNGKIFWLFTPGEQASGLGPFLNRDHFASFAVLALPAAASEMLRHRSRWVFAVATATLYAAVIAGASRAGSALITVEVILLFLLLGFSGRAVSATIALVVLVVFVVGWQSLYDRIRAPDPYFGRRELAQSSVRMIQANPWKGTGLGTWTEVYPAYARKDFGVFVNAAHNDWLQWAADGGIPFAGLFLILFAGSVVVVRRVPWALGVPMVFLHSLVDFPMQGRFLPPVVFLILGVAARTSQRLREDSMRLDSRGGVNLHGLGQHPGGIEEHLASEEIQAE